jgi:hypothetical protein
MTPVARSGAFDALAMGAAAVPFAFALIRAVQTGNDLRYFWVAIAGFLGALAVTVVGRTTVKRPIASAALAAVAFIVATTCAVLAALAIGTRLGLGILVVGLAFGGCFAVGALLHVLGRRSRR